MPTICSAVQDTKKNNSQPDAVDTKYRTGPSDFIRTWLICGEFSNLPRVGLETDYLKEHGGEENIHPVAGMSHHRSNGTVAVWTKFTSPDDIIDYISYFKDRPSVENVFAYAFTTVNTEKAGPAYIGLGSDDGVRVWLNGKLVHNNFVRRGTVKDEDIIPVNLRKGTNTILVKVVQGDGGWGFVLRFMSDKEVEKKQAYEKLKKELQDFQNCKLKPENELEFMFTPGKFPEIVWENPDRVEKIIGKSPLNIKWFNNKLDEVSKPSEIGRYIMYAECESEKIGKIRRSMTFFCRPEEWRPWDDKLKAYMTCPEKSPINKKAWDEKKEMIAGELGNIFNGFITSKENGAILMSYLNEMQPGSKESSSTDNPKVKNNDKHLALKQKLLGIKSEKLKFPAKRKDKAVVLRKGTEKEAGVRPGTTAKIRKICRKWYEESKEPFVILVARRGVIIIHEAFDDEKTGKTKLDTPLYMASITKAMCGMMFAQFIDQGLINLDDPVGKYLPDFPTNGENKITLRHCFTHTTGLEGHYEWGGVHNSWLDNVVLNGMGYLTPGKIHQYNGMGYDLAAKVMEVVSGKSIIRLMQENFFEPLGVKNTKVDDMACATTSTAEDIARMGQLLLNRGSYGNRQFFFEETFEKLTPKPLGQFYPGIEPDWGIGLTWMRERNPEEGKNGVPVDSTLLSTNTIGHGAASSAIMRVDLNNEVVVSQVRNTAGKNFTENFIKFLKAIDESIIDRKQ